MATVTTTLNAPFDADDLAAATLVIKEENQRRIAASSPGNPATTLPTTGTQAVIKASVETALNAKLAQDWAGFRERAAQEQLNEDSKTLWLAATPEQRAAAIAALQSA